MEVFRDLFIRGEADRLALTLEAIERSLSDGWTRDRLSEDRLRPVTGRTKPIYCFACSRAGRRPAATLFLTQRDPGTLSVSNVVPQQQHQLSHGEYNALVEEFYERFVRPCSASTGVEVELTDTQVDLGHWLSPLAAEKLRTLSAAANKSTGSSHPNDQERWIDFVLAAHREGSRLDAPSLRRWLIEVEGWSPEVADQLAVEYDFGRELLAFSDRLPQSA